MFDAIAAMSTLRSEFGVNSEMLLLHPGADLGLILRLSALDCNGRRQCIQLRASEDKDDYYVNILFHDGVRQLLERVLREEEIAKNNIRF